MARAQQFDNAQRRVRFVPASKNNFIRGVILQEEAFEAALQFGLQPVHRLQNAHTRQISGHRERIFVSPEVARCRDEKSQKHRTAGQPHQGAKQQHVNEHVSISSRTAVAELKVALLNETRVAARSRLTNYLQNSAYKFQGVISMLTRTANGPSR